jgi:hypothetical protein
MMALSRKFLCAEFVPIRIRKGRAILFEDVNLGRLGKLLDDLSRKEQKALDDLAEKSRHLMILQSGIGQLDIGIGQHNREHSKQSLKTGNDEGCEAQLRVLFEERSCLVNEESYAVAALGLARKKLLAIQSRYDRLYPRFEIVQTQIQAQESGVGEFALA